MTERVVSIETARRLAVTRQRLAGPTPLVPDAAAILDVVRDLTCLQLDPISVVARSHLLVLAARLGAFDVGELDRLLWRDRAMFEYWAHRASIVLTEDFPIHEAFMRSYGATHAGDGRAPSARQERMRRWLQENERLRRHILRQIRTRGPIRSRDLESTESIDWVSKGWTGGRNVSQMLDYLWTKGVIAVAGRSGLEKVWDLAARWYPQWTPRRRLTPRQVTELAAPRSLRSLGVATARQIASHFIPGRYHGLGATLDRLRRRGEVVPLRVLDDGSPLPGEWLVHAADLELIESIERGGWQPRTVLLSPFDNLIWDRARAETLFGFPFRMEIYVPKDKRRFGYYTMPVLHGDRIVAIADPLFDRSARALRVNAIHPVEGAPTGRPIRAAITRAVEDLGQFLGASRVDLPRGWR